MQRATDPSEPPPPADAGLMARVLDALPQTQCAQCGFDGCRPYAEAVAAGTAPINRCPPGGSVGIATLARLTGQPVAPLDAACGAEGPLPVAWIDPARCIGCTLCIRACPVDAIVGARRRMHVVIAADCTGCARCVAPCPMDCIVMHPAVRDWSRDDARAARQRHDARAARLLRDSRPDETRVQRDAAQAAIVRARARRAALALAGAPPAVADGLPAGVPPDARTAWPSTTPPLPADAATAPSPR